MADDRARRPSSDPVIYLINRNADADRLARFEAMVAPWKTPFVRVPAVDGDNFTEYDMAAKWLGPRFWGSERFASQAVGSSLSAVRLWEMIANGPEGGGLIVEDAVLFSDDPMRYLRRLPREHDVVMVNHRLAAWAPAADHGAYGDDFVGASGASKPIDVRDFAELAVAGINGERRLDVGAEGYLLSKVGARKLLERLERVRIRCPHDWFVLFAGLPPRLFPLFEAADGGPHQQIRRLIRWIGAQEPVLDVGVAVEALVHLDPFRKDDVQSEGALRHRSAFAPPVADTRLRH